MLTRHFLFTMKRLRFSSRHSRTHPVSSVYHPLPPHNIVTSISPSSSRRRPSVSSILNETRNETTRLLDIAMMLPNDPPRQSDSCPRHRLTSTRTRPSTIFTRGISCINHRSFEPVSIDDLNLYLVFIMIWIKGKCSFGGLCFVVWRAVVILVMFSS